MGIENFEYCKDCKNRKECFENRWCITMDRRRKIDNVYICDNYEEEE